MEQLPAEILEQILECIAQDDTTSVLSKLPCFHSICLTSRLLLIVTRPYLYQTVYLNDINQFNTLYEALKSETSLVQYTSNVFLGASRNPWPAEEVVPFVTAHFSKAVEVAWTEVDKDGLCHGHHYSQPRRSPLEQGQEREQACFIEAYHVLLPSLHWSYFSLLISCDVSKLTHITVTVRKL